jgi:hypothetical protein
MKHPFSLKQLGYGKWRTRLPPCEYTTKKLFYLFFSDLVKPKLPAGGFRGQQILNPAGPHATLSDKKERPGHRGSSITRGGGLLQLLKKRGNPPPVERRILLNLRSFEPKTDYYY